MFVGVWFDRSRAPAIDLKDVLGDTSGRTLPPMHPVGPARPVERFKADDADIPVHPFGPAPRDPGGNLYAYFGAVLRADALNVPVRIKGTCISACTVYLGARDACVEPGAVLWFHAAQTGGRIDDVATMQMAGYWPPAVRDWASGAGVMKSPVFTRRRALTGAELIAMGVKPC